MRDVDVWVTGTDVASLSGNSSTATATGHFNVQYVDAMNGQRYTGFEFSGGNPQIERLERDEQGGRGIRSGAQTSGWHDLPLNRIAVDISGGVWMIACHL